MLNSFAVFIRSTPSSLLFLLFFLLLLLLLCRQPRVSTQSCRESRHAALSLVRVGRRGRCRRGIPPTPPSSGALADMISSSSCCHSFSRGLSNTQSTADCPPSWSRSWSSSSWTVSSERSFLYSVVYFLPPFQSSIPVPSVTLTGIHALTFFFFQIVSLQTEVKM